VSAASSLAVNVLDPHSLLSSFGAVGVGVVLFAETGLLIGFFLPGDSLLFTAGVLAAAPASAALHLSLGWVLLCVALGACLGAQAGYWIGRRVGPALFERPHRARLRDGRDRAEHYLGRYGYGKAIVLARFVPVVRTVLNPLAGALGVPQRTFTVWQVTGGLLWSLGLGPGRLPARLAHHQRGSLPAADHRRRHRRLPDPDRRRTGTRPPRQPGHCVSTPRRPARGLGPRAW
jgi:membrane-associated protein